MSCQVIRALDGYQAQPADAFKPTMGLRLQQLKISLRLVFQWPRVIRMFL